MSELERAKALLEEGKFTLALVKGGVPITSKERGVRPLLRLIQEERDVRSYAAADRVVGRAAAFLYVLLGVKEVYAKVISKLAEEVLLGHGIAVFCGTRTERIRSYAGGYCPMETAVEHCEDAESALAAILKRLAELNKQ